MAFKILAETDAEIGEYAFRFTNCRVFDDDGLCRYKPNGEPRIVWKNLRVVRVDDPAMVTGDLLRRS